MGVIGVYSLRFSHWPSFGSKQAVFFKWSLICAIIGIFSKLIANLLLKHANESPKEVDENQKEAFFCQRVAKESGKEDGISELSAIQSPRTVILLSKVAVLAK